MSNSVLSDGAVDIERDRQLVIRCQQGERSAFDELYRRYHRRLVAFCLRRLGEGHEAEDAAQEALTKAWRALPNFSGERRFYPWLTVIAANACTDVLRRRGRLLPVAEVPVGQLDRAADVGDDMDAGLVDRDDARAADLALDQLSPRHRRVLSLREKAGWSTKRIADYEGVPVPVMETVLWRARRALQREFAALSDTGKLAGFALLGALTALGQALRGAARRARPASAWRGGATAHTIGRALGGLAAGPSRTVLATVGGVVVATGVTVTAVNLAAPVPPPTRPQAPLGLVASGPPAAVGLPGGREHSRAVTSSSSAPATFTPAPSTPSASPTRNQDPSDTPPITLRAGTAGRDTSANVGAASNGVVAMAGSRAAGVGSTVAGVGSTVSAARSAVAGAGSTLSAADNTVAGLGSSTASAAKGSLPGVGGVVTGARSVVSGDGGSLGGL